MSRKIVVLATGGTIAGKAASASDNVGYTAAQVGVAQLLAGIPTPDGVEIVGEQVAQIDSKDMSFDVWRTLAARCAHWLAIDDVHGIVITHGTDTLEESAYFLHRVLASSKPVILTCAMRPSTALVPDGPQNVADAIAVAASGDAHGVVVVCAGVVHSALAVAKNHTYQLNAFTSGESGPIGFVEEGALRKTAGWPAQANDAARSFADFAKAESFPRVEIVMNYAGASGAIVDAIVTQGIDGIVVAGTGNGTLHHSLEDALLRARDQGVEIVRATRCANGRVIPHARDLIADSQGLAPVKARIDLLLRLMR